MDFLHQESGHLTGMCLLMSTFLSSSFTDRPLSSTSQHHIEDIRPSVPNVTILEEYKMASMSKIIFPEELKLYSTTGPRSASKKTQELTETSTMGKTIAELRKKQNRKQKKMVRPKKRMIFDESNGECNLDDDFFPKKEKFKSIHYRSIIMIFLNVVIKIGPLLNALYLWRHNFTASLA